MDEETKLSLNDVEKTENNVEDSKLGNSSLDNDEKEKNVNDNSDLDGDVGEEAKDKDEESNEDTVSDIIEKYKDNEDELIKNLQDFMNKGLKDASGKEPLIYGEVHTYTYTNNQTGKTEESKEIEPQYLIYDDCCNVFPDVLKCSNTLRNNFQSVPGWRQIESGNNVIFKLCVSSESWIRKHKPFTYDAETVQKVYNIEFSDKLSLLSNNEDLKLEIFSGTEAPKPFVACKNVDEVADRFLTNYAEFMRQEKQTKEERAKELEDIKDRYNKKKNDLECCPAN